MNYVTKVRCIKTEVPDGHDFCRNLTSCHRFFFLSCPTARNRRDVRSLKTLCRRKAHFSAVDGKAASVRAIGKEKRRMHYAKKQVDAGDGQGEGEGS